MTERWQNQQEAYKFAMDHDSCMLAMDMGTGKTRVAIDVSLDRADVKRVLVVCPKAVVPVWSLELAKHAGDRPYLVISRSNKTALIDSKRIDQFINSDFDGTKYVIVNYDSVWRGELGNKLLKHKFDMVILDESHRVKTAGSKVSKYAYLLSKRVKYKLCLTGTPMANSPLDVYGQYRFLDSTIFGTNHYLFLQQYAILGGPDRRFVVGFKNQKELNEKYQSIAYTCSMNDVSQRLKLPEVVPPKVIPVSLPSKDMRTIRTLTDEFIAECQSGMIVLNNVLTRALRIQQIAAGFCVVCECPGGEDEITELNSTKEEALLDYMTDIPITDSIVVFCVFKHDISAVHRVGAKLHRQVFELSGNENTLGEWQKTPGSVIAVQIQAGAEGVNMTMAHHAVYFTLPYSLALYEQSKARLYRPGQEQPVVYSYLIARDTIDEVIYNNLMHKRGLIDAIKSGALDYGTLKSSNKHIDTDEYGVV